MDSPSAQLVSYAGESAPSLDGPPSSPFLTYVQSRLASHQSGICEEESATPVQMSQIGLSERELDADKENIPQMYGQEDYTIGEKEGSPRKSSTPKPKAGRQFSPLSTVSRRSSNTSDSMRLSNSIRKTPNRRSPHKQSYSITSTPRPPVHDGASPESTPPSLRTPSLRPEQDGTISSNNADDTCFSTFTEVPDLATWARSDRSPAKACHTSERDVALTPRTSRKRTSSSRSPSPTPRRQKTPANHDGTTFLIDFTQQMEGIPDCGLRSYSKPPTQPDLLKYMKDQRSPYKTSRQSYSTPAKQNNILNLLDFELPPAPTPRSVPTITVRELESLKSSYLSQISSLKATLNGREAEVESLKRAVNDAERRVGEAQEKLREESIRREYAEQEKSGWERRGQELENVLKSVKEEAIKGDAEKDELIHRLEDCERRAEDAEARAITAEERFEDALAAKASSGGGNDTATIEEQVQRLVVAQIDAKIEAVSRELHTVYKEKHERKVAILKKSYEVRSEKKCAELLSRVSELEKQNDELLSAKDATFSGPVPGELSVFEAGADLKGQLEEQRAHLARLEIEVQTSRQQQEELMRELQQERIEKGELVAAVDEMLMLQSEQSSAKGAMVTVEDFRKSISRPPSRARAPGGGIPALAESKIGKGATLNSSRNRSNGPMVKSSMLANIERMGRTGSGTLQE